MLHHHTHAFHLSHHSLTLAPAHWLGWTHCGREEEEKEKEEEREEEEEKEKEEREEEKKKKGRRRGEGGGSVRNKEGGGISQCYSFCTVSYTWLFDVEPARSLETTLQYQPLQTGGKRKKG